MLISLFVQALLQAHDVVAHEVYGELAPQISPDPTYQNGLENKEAQKQCEDENTPEITRIRLVQFVKNSNEPLVRW